MKNHRNYLPTNINLWNPIHLLATGFGSGASPYMPGTAGTLVAIPLYYLLQLASLPIYTLILAAIILFGFVICEIANRAIGVYDHPSIVWDEIAGYLLTMWAVPEYWMWTVLGFLLFRLFDIWKPWPIRWINDEVGDGIGIMADDLMAAVYASIILHILVGIF